MERDRQLRRVFARCSAGPASAAAAVQLRRLASISPSSAKPAASSASGSATRARRRLYVVGPFVGERQRRERLLDPRTALGSISSALRNDTRACAVVAGGELRFSQADLRERVSSAAVGSSSGRRWTAPALAVAGGQLGQPSVRPGWPGCRAARRPRSTPPARSLGRRPSGTSTSHYPRRGVLGAALTASSRWRRDLRRPRRPCATRFGQCHGPGRS